MNRSMLSKISNLLVVVLGKNDIAIVIGAVVLFLAILFARRQQKR